MKKDFRQMNERIALWAGFVKTPQVAVKTDSGTEHADVWALSDVYMSFKMPDFTNFKIFEKFIIPTLHAWKIEYLGNNVVNARVVDENGVAYDAENEKPTVALCLAVEKMAQG